MKYLVPIAIYLIDDHYVQPLPPKIVEASDPVAALLEVKRILLEEEIDELGPEELLERDGDEPYYVWHFQYWKPEYKQIGTWEEEGYVLGDPIPINSSFELNLTSKP